MLPIDWLFTELTNHLDEKTVDLLRHEYVARDVKHKRYTGLPYAAYLMYVANNHNLTFSSRQAASIAQISHSLIYNTLKRKRVINLQDLFAVRAYTAEDETVALRDILSLNS